MVLEVSNTVPQAAFGAKCNAKCFDYSKTGARPKTTSSVSSTQPSWTSSVAKTSSAQQAPKKENNGAWGPVFKNKKNFVDMHMF